MTKPGTLIAIEGIDGSGKHTQAKLLDQSLRRKGYDVLATGFPQYDSWFGQLVGKFLNGEFGPLDKVDPHFAALLYAGDRFAARQPIVDALAEGRVVLVDRYIASNLAHQAARVPAEKRSAFLTWIEHLEYTIYGMPRESLILYLRIPPLRAQKLIAKKTERSYTAATHDIQEADIRHLEDAAEMYDMMSRSQPWATIQCFDAQHNCVREPEDIAREIAEAVESVLAARSKG